MFNKFLEIFNNRGWKKNIRTIKLGLKEKCKYFHNRKLLFQSKEKKSRNGDTLGPVELIVWPEQGNQGDRREQDDQGEVSIII